MLDFEFRNPVNIYFGKTALNKLPDLINDKKKILLVFGGGSIKKNGTYQKIEQVIGHKNIVQFGGVEANPEFDTLMKAVELGRDEEVDFILAVGGGSVIDGVKFISAAIPFSQDDAWKVITQSNTIKKVIPFGTVLTLPATGSEMNPFAVISRKSMGVKRDFESDLLFPQFSLLDPTLTFSLDKRQVGNGIVDSFVHVIEQYLTYPVNTPLQDRWAEGILKTLVEEGPKTFNNPTDYDSRANLMWCATLALNGLIAKGVVSDWSTHQIGHELTAQFGIDHARTLAAVLPGLLRTFKKEKRAKILQFGERIWNVSNGSQEERIETTIQKMERFFQSVGVPTKLSDYNVSKENIPALVEKFKKRRSFGENGDIDHQKVEKILLANL